MSRMVSIWSAYLGAPTCLLGQSSCKPRGFTNVECNYGNLHQCHSCCGRYTLGGFYLARYTDSPVGPFDEVSGMVRWLLGLSVATASDKRLRHVMCALQLVAMAGLIWNFPTSCAWAARVYVNNWCADFLLCHVAGHVVQVFAFWISHKHCTHRGPVYPTFPHLPSEGPLHSRW
jgi:hypothetical protein